MNERIKKLRRSLDLTQQEFADRIGVKRNTIANYEIGRNVPIDSVLALIVREFHVNEMWLRSGEGEMFAPSATSALDTLAKEQNLTHGEYILIEKLLHLKPEVRQGILDYIIEVAAAVNADNAQACVPEKPGLDIEAEVESYRRELEIQEEAAGRSSASGGRNATG